MIRLRNATRDDVHLLQQWDEQEYLQNPDTMGDAEYNDWNWEYELSRSNLPWRWQLIAETNTTNTTNNMDMMIPIGFIQLIDPALEESDYWGCQEQQKQQQQQQLNHTTDNSTIISPGTVWAMDIWIGNPDYLGQGYGTVMMETALQQYCFVQDNNKTNAVEAVWVDPMANNLSAQRFYQKFGFEPQGIRYFGPDRCLVHVLTRLAYLQTQQRGRNEDEEKLGR